MADPSASGSSQYPPCAACAHLRRTCSRDCKLVPHFPADRPERFRNAFRHFRIGENRDGFDFDNYIGQMNRLSDLRLRLIHEQRRQELLRPQHQPPPPDLPRGLPLADGRAPNSSSSSSGGGPRHPQCAACAYLGWVCSPECKLEPYSEAVSLCGLSTSSSTPTASLPQCQKCGLQRRLCEMGCNLKCMDLSGVKFLLESAKAAFPADSTTTASQYPQSGSSSTTTVDHQRERHDHRRRLFRAHPLTTDFSAYALRPTPTSPATVHENAESSTAKANRSSVFGVLNDPVNENDPMAAMMESFMSAMNTTHPPPPTTTSTSDDEDIGKYLVDDAYTAEEEPAAPAEPVGIDELPRPMSPMTLANVRLAKELLEQEEQLVAPPFDERHDDD
uniref:LOB domain-containing protein n=1 Tax=Leersia perrieri TaxID=77586 RepID=A0A0D9V267_9ORYZ